MWNFAHGLSSMSFIWHVLLFTLRRMSTHRGAHVCLEPLEKKLGKVFMSAQSAQSSDQALVERVQKGDKRAFDLLVLKDELIALLLQ